MVAFKKNRTNNLRPRKRLSIHKTEFFFLFRRGGVEVISGGYDSEFSAITCSGMEYKLRKFGARVPLLLHIVPNTVSRNSSVTGANTWGGAVVQKFWKPSISSRTLNARYQKTLARVKNGSHSARIGSPTFWAFKIRGKDWLEFISSIRYPKIVYHFVDEQNNPRCIANALRGGGRRIFIFEHFDARRIAEEDEAPSIFR